ncbi:mitochondrial ribosomal protein [Savitreella phatthalungensis]
MADKGKASDVAGNSSGSADRSGGVPMSVDGLATQLMQIAQLTRQNTKMLVAQGQDIMRLDAQQHGLIPPSAVSATSTNTVSAGGDGQNAAPPAGDFVDAGTLDELVAQLSMKLDELEERSVRRVHNSGLVDLDDEIDWLPDGSGEPEFALPEESGVKLPRTISELEGCDARTLLECMKGYGLAHYEDGMPLPTKQEENALFDELARFLGLRTRRSSKRNGGQAASK